jgi:hypothetical protein
MYLITANKISADIPEKQRAILDKNIKDRMGKIPFFR